MTTNLPTARSGRAYLAANAAIRAEQGFQVGDRVRIKGGGHGSEEGRITGVSVLGGWELWLDSGFSYTMQNNRGLVAARAAVNLAPVMA